eukprot:TRINITY_DN36759_c0_g1_i1.p1 TRINITY_DN36759_c0_g1~~TRINITY_DN36759_c0_g1_i1.p1  ORF type:complete len:364 (+),score=51.98 TRINITY_DN36759_c0_g1_i1:209-1300(+)
MRQLASNPGLKAELMCSGVPFVVTGLRNECVGWTLDQISHLFGETRNWVRKFGRTHPKSLEDCLEMEFSQWIDSLVSGEARLHDMYWAYSQPGPRFERGIKHATDFFEMESMLNQEKNGAGGLVGWVGAANHVERLHYDSDANLHLVLRGRKRWLLYPPEAALGHEPHPNPNPEPHPNPDPEAALAHELGFPKLPLLVLFLVCNHPLPQLQGVQVDPATASLDPNHLMGGPSAPIVVHVSAGQMIYIPPTWLHQVESAPGDGKDNPNSGEEPWVLSVNRFYEPSWPLMGAAAELWVAISLWDACRSHVQDADGQALALSLKMGWVLTAVMLLSLIHISEPTRLLSISYAVFCLKKKKKTNRKT